MNSLLSLLGKNKAVENLLTNKGRLVIQDHLALAYLVSAAFIKSEKNISIVANNLYTAQSIYEQISSLLGEDNCLLYPMDEVFHQTNYAYSKEMLSQRLYVLNKTFDNKKRILITHVCASRRYLPLKSLYQENNIKLKRGSTYSLLKLVKQLTDMSFTRVNKVDQSLQFALRGDILDIFPINEEKPIRIEFFDDEIESIRYFEITNQTSFEEIEDIEIFPSSDLLFTQDQKEKALLKIKNKLLEDTKSLDYSIKESLINQVNSDISAIENKGLDESLYRYFHFFFDELKVSIFDYFKADINIFYQINEINSSLDVHQNELCQYIGELYKNGLSLNDFNQELSLFDIVKNIPNNINSFSYFASDDDYGLNIKSIPFFASNLINSLSLIKEYAKTNKVIISLSEQYFDIYKDFLKDNNIDFEIIENKMPSKSVALKKDDLQSGFELLDEKIIFLSKKEIFGYKQNLTLFSSRYKKAVILNSYEELQIGDYIVHEENGIGRYEGIVTLTANEITQDYLKIMYANEQVLYVPLTKFSTIRKYVSREGSVPRLSRIGGKDWSKTKEKIKEKVNFLAERLIKLYAEREATPGFAFKKDDEFQNQFESTFPYTLTQDQTKAIEEIKKDMERPVPMDRLLCGDVGFGKTEVAFRAAFKAILSNKQVAILCPTTILAKQHYDVAQSRFALFGVKIAIFSRFISDARQHEYIEQIKKGDIHLIIGTHRLLSKEIEIPNLGLLIVDEEQRFGVEHKERIKEMSKNIDVLTLTATPIPRTLQMSLLGIRNLSQLRTPPFSRMPIQTYVMPYNARLSKEAISRELSRGGQVFYLHNRVSSIYQKAKDLSTRLPQARISVVHAKMDKDDIDDIMTEFYSGNIDVLVCTSIIEAGLDVPNANTIIIENADTFGLSQLYQIKGRVGRSNKVAYAYLFYNQNKELNEIADKRLKAIKEFTELGSGIKIAQKDLNIRGAGDILGSEQSGFIDTVGIDMYVSILSEVIQDKKGMKKQDKKTKSTNITIGGYIPSTYALDSDKIELYQEIEACNSLSSIEILRRKIRDIYGRIPSEVDKIFLKRKIDILSSNYNIESVVEEETINIILTKEFSTTRGLATKLGEKFMDIYEDIYVKFIDKHLIIKLKKNKKSINNLIFILQTINAFDLVN